MSDIDRDELRRLLDEATPGPWVAEGSQVWGPDGGLVAAVREHSTLVDRPDALIIAAAVNALPALLDAAELLADVRDQVTRGALCPMCSTGMIRRTVGLVCQLCGTDYSRQIEDGNAILRALDGPDA